MVVCHLPYGPTAYFGIFNTVLRHDIGEKKEVRGCRGYSYSLSFNFIFFRGSLFF